MINDGDNLIGRRGVLRSFARFGVVGLLGGLAVAGEAKRRRLLRDGKCVGLGACGGCGAFGDCGLPLAIAEKQNQLKTGGTGGGYER